MGRMVGALLRALLMAVLVIVPALLVPDIGVDATQMTVLMAFLAAVLTFVEYHTDAPSIVAFRGIAPVNRLRFATLLIMVVALAITCRGFLIPSTMTEMVAAWGSALPLSYLPTQALLLSLPDSTGPAARELIAACAALAYTVSLIATAIFFLGVRSGWLVPSAPVNLWKNLPLFDPSAGADITRRLSRNAWTHIILGITLPFVLPMMVKAAGNLLDLGVLTPHTLVWTLSAWAFLPASMIMRGIVVLRIAADLKGAGIEEAGLQAA